MVSLQTEVARDMGKAQLSEANKKKWLAAAEASRSSGNSKGLAEAYAASGGPEKVVIESTIREVVKNELGGAGSDPSKVDRITREVLAGRATGPNLLDKITNKIYQLGTFGMGGQ
jgi:hypothetical protein